MSKKQTAVEWLCQQFEQTIGRSIMLVMESEIEQAKQMEKQRAIDFAKWFRSEECETIIHDFELLGEDTSVENLHNTYSELYDQSN